MNKIMVFVFVLALVVLLSACGEKDFPYTDIPDVPKEVNDLGRMIGQQQRNVVTPGGNEWKPGFSYNDQVKFENSDKLEKIVKEVSKSNTFKKGVEAIRALPPETRERIYNSFRTPIYPTWAMNGRISDEGTTDAGYVVERQIANALTEAVIEAVGEE